MATQLAPRTDGRRAPRVLHLINWLTTGGIERWILQMIEEMDRSRYELDVLCKGKSTGPLAHIAEANGARVWHVPMDWAHVRFASRLRKLIRDEGYDIVHNHLTVYSGLPTLVSTSLGVPTIVSFHNMAHKSSVFSNPLLLKARSLYGSVSIPLAIRLADRVTGCSEDVVRFHEEKYHIPSEKTRVVYYGVDIPPRMTASQRAEFRRELGVPADAPLLLHVGRLAPQKNHAGLLRMMKHLLLTHPTARLLLVGGGILQDEIAAQVRELGLQQHVHLLGVRQDVERIMSVSDIFVLPSIWEGFGLVAIEASAAGIPVVGSDVPGLREAVRHGETGFLLPGEDHTLFVNTLRTLLDADALRTRLGEAGRQHVLAKFSRRASSAGLSALYDECIRAGSRVKPIITDPSVQ